MNQKSEISYYENFEYFSQNIMMVFLLGLEIVLFNPIMVNVPQHLETSQLINHQLTGFNMMGEH